MTELDKRLDTRGASAFLTARGYTTAPATLNKLRCIGGGPVFEMFGRRPLYKETALLEWVRARTTPPLRSTPTRHGCAARKSTLRGVERSPGGAFGGPCDAETSRRPLVGTNGG